MEFDSAVRAYQRVGTHGFRTFIKLPGEGVFYEPFTATGGASPKQCI
jgi:hypothetical protein